MEDGNNAEPQINFPSADPKTTSSQAKSSSIERKRPSKNRRNRVNKNGHIKATNKQKQQQSNADNKTSKREVLATASVVSDDSKENNSTIIRKAKYGDVVIFRD